MEKQSLRLDQITIETTQKDIFPVVESINQYFDGNMYQLSRFLDKSIYWLHHIPDSDLFSQKERQDICFALVELKEALLESFFEQQSKNN
jgi:hypothetical protein